MNAISKLTIAQVEYLEKIQEATYLKNTQFLNNLPAATRKAAANAQRKWDRYNQTDDTDAAFEAAAKEDIELINAILAE